jgi:hypothetical protein
LATRSVEGDHELAPAPLAERLLRDRALELGDELGGPAAVQLGVEAVLDRAEAQSVEAGCLCRASLDVGEPGVCLTPPLGEGGAEYVRRGSGLAAGKPFRSRPGALLEPPGVDLIRLDPQPVSPAYRLDQRRRPCGPPPVLE